MAVSARRTRERIRLVESVTAALYYTVARTIAYRSLRSRTERQLIAGAKQDIFLATNHAESKGDAKAHFAPLHALGIRTESRAHGWQIVWRECLSYRQVKGIECFDDPQSL